MNKSILTFTINALNFFTIIQFVMGAFSILKAFFDPQFWIYGITLLISGVFTLAFTQISRFILEYLIKNGYELEDNY